MKKQEFEKRKQEILEPLFLNKEQALFLREKNLQAKEKEYKVIEKINQELKLALNQIISKVGHIIRDFELRNPPTDETKNYLNKLWDEFCKEIPRRFSSDMETREEKRIKLDKKIEKKRKELKNIREKRRRLNLEVRNSEKDLKEPKEDEVGK